MSKNNFKIKVGFYCQTLVLKLKNSLLILFDTLLAVVLSNRIVLEKVDGKALHFTKNNNNIKFSLITHFYNLDAKHGLADQI